MATIKTNQSYNDITGKRLINISQLRLFNILRDDDSEYFMNIFRSFNINEEVVNNTLYYNSYEVGDNEWWDNISYSVYETPNLWWIIAMVNNVVNPFEELTEGDIIKYLRKEYLYTLMRDVEGISQK